MALIVIGVVLVALWSFSAAVVAGRADRRGEEMRDRALRESQSRNVWRMLESVPGFREGMARAEEDFRSGRAHRFRHRDDSTEHT